MKLLNWAKEKLRALSNAIGRKQFGEIPRFNNLAPVVSAPSREERSRHRKRLRLRRWLRMNVGHGCPVLAGERLRKTQSSCDPVNLTVLPRYMRAEKARGAAC